MGDNIGIVKEKNVGIQLLRIIAIYMVVTIHIICVSGCFQYVFPDFKNAHAILSVIVHGLCFCAVDVYAIISGFVGYKSKLKIKTLCHMWVFIFLMGAISYVLRYTVLDHPFDTYELLRVFFPITLRSYWYASDYFTLALFIPLINKSIALMNKKQHLGIVGILTLLVSIFGLFIPDFWGKKGSFCLILLVVLYYIGAYLGKYGPIRVKTKWLVLEYLALLFIEIGTFFFVNFLGMQNAIFYEAVEKLHSYNNIVVIFQAVILVTLFSRMQFKEGIVKKSVLKVAALTFGIYIIHCTDFIWDVMGILATYIPQYSAWCTVPLILSMSMLFFIICGISDYLRQLLFKIIKLDKGIDYCYNKLYNLYSKILDKIISSRDSKEEPVINNEVNK